MERFAPRLVCWWAGPGPAGHLLSRWLFLRALGVIYFSAFYSLIFQIKGLLGPQGLLPAGSYLGEVAKLMPGPSRFWYAPTVLWFNSSDHALMALCWVGLVAAVLLFVNFSPRAALAVSFLCFLSFVAAAQDFSGYQSDGMLLCAGFVALFFAPSGVRPGLAENQPPSRAPRFMLLMLWFTIYFESGVAKYFGGDPSWRDFSAMNQYYQNGPLPTWIGWYAQQLPRWAHEATAFVTVFTELVIVCMVFLPRVFRIVCFFIVTFLQIGIILTANYAFLNYLVLALGILLVDDSFLVRLVPRHWRARLQQKLAAPSPACPPEPSAAPIAGRSGSAGEVSLFRRFLSDAAICFRAFCLGWLFYATAFLLVEQISPGLPLPGKPVTVLEPFRIANSYGLFGRMTWARYEIEFQGSNDGMNWTPYPFRYKPQRLDEAPGIYAPYQPRFEWNLWFAALGGWRENPFVLRVQEQLLRNNQDVLELFRSNPFPKAPPTQVRSIIWQYWCTDRATKKATGRWWRREDRGLYSPTLERTAEDKIIAVDWPQNPPPPP